MKVFSFTAVLFLVGVAHSAPLEEDNSSPKEVMHYSYLLDGFDNETTGLGASRDAMHDNELMKSDALYSAPREDYSGITSERNKWRNGFYVQFDPAFNDQDYRTAYAGLVDIYILLKDCIRFGVWPRNSRPTGDYVFVRKGGPGSGCNSLVGKGGGRQVVNLQSPGCLYGKGTTIHEFGHALGFYHEHNRPDRDSYVKILYENIEPRFIFAFNKATNSKIYGTRYDYTSIMHYGPKAFSKNRRNTIEAWNGAKIGSQGVLTDLDKQKMRNMYC